MRDWHGLMKILEIEQVRNGKVLWRETNIRNTMHLLGERFVLQCAFDNDGSLPPASLYLGLDNRADINEADIIDDLTDEPVTNGYLRQTVSTASGFTIELLSGIYRAVSQVVTFSATGGNVGPVSKLFLATTSDNSGVLLASAPLSSTTTIVDGDAINMRMALSLRDDA